MTRENNYQRIINYLAYGLLVIVPLVMFPDGRRFNIAISKFVVLAALMLIFIGITLYRRRFDLRLDQTENKWLLAYVLLVVVSTFFALDPKLAVFGSIARRDGLITFSFYLMAYLVGREMKLKWDHLLMAILGSVLLIDLFGLLQFFKLDPSFLQLYPGSWRGMVFSTMGNPNFLGSYLTLTLPVTMYFYLFRSKWYGLVMYGLTYFTLLGTRTRGSWIGALFGFLVMVWFYYRQAENKALARRRILILMILSILLFGLFILATEGTILQKILALFTDIQLILTDPDDADTAGSNRFYIWQLTLDLIKDRPIFGVGVENMSVAMHQTFYDKIVADWGKYRNWDKAHNEYLNIALASGIPSLIAYLGFIFIIMKKAFHRLKDCPELILFFAAASGYLVQALFNIQMVQVYYFFMVVLGILSSQRICDKEEYDFGGDVYSDHDGDGL